MKHLVSACLAILVAGCTTTSGDGIANRISPSPSVTTLMAGWQQKFDVEWHVAPEPAGTQRIEGYVVSRYGRTAEPLRVLVLAVDASGAELSHRIVWIPGGVSGFGRSYFEVGHLPSADHFVVSIWDYSLRKEPSSS